METIIKPIEGFEVTRCAECSSDEIYSFEDSDGGMCIKCKLLITGPIRGGISKLEMRRRRGETVIHDEPVPPKEIVSEPLPKSIQAIIDARKPINSVVQMLEKSSTKIAKVVEVEKPKGPGLIRKAVGFFRELQKEIKDTAPKPEAPKPAMVNVTVSAPVAAPYTLDVRGFVPIVGETWTLNKCIVCKRQKPFTGQVFPATGYPRKYIWVRASGYGEQFGCFLCAKKS